MRYKVFAKGCPVSRGRIRICDMNKLVSEIFLLLNQYSFANSLVGYINIFLVSGMVCGMKQIPPGQVTAANLRQEGNEVRNASLEPMMLQTGHILCCFKSSGVCIL